MKNHQKSKLRNPRNQIDRLEKSVALKTSTPTKLFRKLRRKQRHKKSMSMIEESMSSLLDSQCHLHQSPTQPAILRPTQDTSDTESVSENLPGFSQLALCKGSIVRVKSNLSQFTKNPSKRPRKISMSEINSNRRLPPIKGALQRLDTNYSELETKTRSSKAENVIKPIKVENATKPSKADNFIRNLSYGLAKKIEKSMEKARGIQIDRRNVFDKLCDEVLSSYDIDQSMLPGDMGLIIYKNEHKGHVNTFNSNFIF